MSRRIGTRAITTLVGVIAAASISAGVLALGAPHYLKPSAATPTIYRASNGDPSNASLAARRKKKHRFKIVANPPAQGLGGFGPAKEQPLSFSVSNPYTYTIRLNSLAVRITSTPVGCDPSWVQIASPVSATNFVDVPHNKTIVLDSAHEPKISLVDLPTVNQDACMGGTFAYAFNATAVRPS